MIKQEDIQHIIETSRIEEVIGDFVTLRKRGVNLLGLCPFHSEKTPSFTVSPVKGIYKCFGCGKAGNAVNFIMEHEHFTYPEALKYLAKKYNIEIEEEFNSEEQNILSDEKESLYNITAFAQKFFIEKLFNSEEGKAIGLSYFKEREFSESTIRKFELGYSSEQWDDLTKFALKSGYQISQLEKAGLCSQKEDRVFDRFRGRVIFPIHSLSGKVIAFGGRILNADKNQPKYINSPETEIYNKSKVLYGLNFAKNTIISNDNCYLVEGYTDVISLHQAGIENVVASSGTSLTTDQIKLIFRYTKNITILYDGDIAGIKASFRGIDMILEQGMNVKIVLFPENDDPDSFTRKNRSADVKEYITKNAKNFILFKTDILLKESSNDPIKKSQLIKEIVNTIALIPDQINRSVYLKECSVLLDIPEQKIIYELNKILRAKFSKAFEVNQQNVDLNVTESVNHQQQDEIDFDVSEYQERDIIRLLLNYGKKNIILKIKNEDNHYVDFITLVAKIIIKEIKDDDFIFNNKIYQLIFNEFAKSVENDDIPDEQYFTHNADKDIREVSINLLSTPFTLSENWRKLHRIYVPTEEDNKTLELSVRHSILSFKLKKVEEKLNQNANQLKTLENADEINILLEEQKKFIKVKKLISSALGRIVIK